MSKFKEYSQHQMMLLPPSLEEKIEEGHIARLISRVVDELKISNIAKSYSGIGCRAYHPRMLLKLLIYGYSTGMRGSRKIQKATREDLVFMWLSGMQEPDFRTISDFRKSRIKDIKHLFRQVLETCKELDLVRCGRISLDGTKLEASSSRHRVTYRKSLEKRKSKYEKEIEEILKEAEAVDEEEDHCYGEHDGYTLDRDFSSDEIKKALQKTRKKRKSIGRKVEKKLEKLEVVKEKLKRMGESRNSFGNTDKDSTLMQMKEGYLGLGYNLQMATENQVIVGYGVYQNRTDYHLLKPMVQEVETNTKRKPEAITADKGYGSQKNYEYMESRSIKAAIPHQNYDFDRIARKKGTYKKSKNLPYERLKLKIMDFLETKEGKSLLKKRKHDVEPTFGDIKQNMGFRKLLLRTKPKVNIEVGLVAIAHNIKKIKSFLMLNQMAFQLV